MKFIDLHTHIAYNLDDGAKTLQESTEKISERQFVVWKKIHLPPNPRKT